MSAGPTVRRFFWNSVGTIRGRGVTYEAQPIGGAWSPDRCAGYFLDLREKTLSAQNPSALLPAALAQLALGFWERHISGDSLASDRFLALVDDLVRRSERSGPNVLWRYDVALPKYGLGPGWQSAMAQGQAASVLVRAAYLTGAGDYAELARAAVRPLRDARTGLVVAGPHGAVLEEAPSTPPSFILNGWVYALWGAWDVASGLVDADASEVFTEGISSLRRTLPEYDTGWWTRYSLYPHALPDLAKPFYHRLHIAQAEMMYRLTGYPEFDAASTRWKHYDNAQNRCQALVHKALFRAVRALRS